MKTTNMFIIGLAVLFCWSGSLYADYMLFLKNSRSITVKRYREEDGKIKVFGLGGEFGIGREQIESIIRVGEGEREGMILPDEEPPPDEAVRARQEGEKVATPGPSGGGKVEEKKEEPVDIREKAKTSEELRAERRAKEEKEYQKRVEEITGQIKAMNDRYAVAIGGSTNFPFKLIRLEESRRSEEYRRLAEKMRSGKLIELGNQIFQLKKEREKLIQEMRQKNFESASLFLE